MNERGDYKGVGTRGKGTSPNFDPEETYPKGSPTTRKATSCSSDSANRSSAETWFSEFNFIWKFHVIYLFSRYHMNSKKATFYNR